MDAPAYEVVWPLHRHHYLHHELNSVNLEDSVIVDTSQPADATLDAPGRVVAARALLAAACTQERVGALLGVSRRTVGRRTGPLEVSAALRDPEALTLARASLADSASRGSTAEERAAAVAWLEAQMRHPAPLEDVQQAEASPTDGSVPSGNRHGRGRPPAPRSPRRRPTVGSNGSHGRSRATAARVRLEPHAASSRGAGLGPEQVEALTHQQARILHRSLVLACAVQTTMPDLGTLRPALADLLADITEAARRIGVILQPHAT